VNGQSGEVAAIAASPTPAVPEPTPVVGPSGRGRTRVLRVGGVLAALLLAPIVAFVGVSAASSGIGPYSQTVEIDIHYSHYTPTLVSVPVGVPIRFVIRNFDPIDHEWIVGDAQVHAIHRTGTEMHHGARPTEVSIAAGQTVETVVTFAATGSLQYICHLPGHEQYGMVGTVEIH
jgi:uncharacterized cupredoxin-like copper-binding protein